MRTLLTLSNFVVLCATPTGSHTRLPRWKISRSNWFSAKWMFMPGPSNRQQALYWVRAHQPSRYNVSFPNRILVSGTMSSCRKKLIRAKLIKWLSEFLFYRQVLRRGKFLHVLRCNARYRGNWHAAVCDPSWLCICWSRWPSPSGCPPSQAPSLARNPRRIRGRAQKSQLKLRRLICVHQDAATEAVHSIDRAIYNTINIIINKTGNTSEVSYHF